MSLRQRLECAHESGFSHHLNAPWSFILTTPVLSGVRGQVIRTISNHRERASLIEAKGGDGKDLSSKPRATQRFFFPSSSFPRG